MFRHNLSFAHSFVKRFFTSKPPAKIEFLETDLVETFVKGSGAGGQSVNKTMNCVQLLHVPSRIRVSSHASRSLADNRKIARKLLVDKLDQLYNGQQSKHALIIKRVQQQKRKQAKRAAAKHGSNVSVKPTDSNNSNDPAAQA
jgi:protein subunit release factor B